jgi:hypothetical protein
VVSLRAAVNTTDQWVVTKTDLGVGAGVDSGAFWLTVVTV